MTDKFFVYGTLKEGGYFAKSFDTVRKSAQKATLAKHDLFRIGGGASSWFPGIVPGEGTVIGEVHEYDHTEQVLEEMDRIEGYNKKQPERSFYMREIKEVELDDGTKVRAYVYIFNNEIPKHYEKVESGDWEI